MSEMGYTVMPSKYTIYACHQLFWCLSFVNLASSFVKFMSKRLFQIRPSGHLFSEYSKIYLNQLSISSCLLSHKSYPQTEKQVLALQLRIIKWSWLPQLRRILELCGGSPRRGMEDQRAHVSREGRPGLWVYLSDVLPVSGLIPLLHSSCWWNSDCMNNIYLTNRIVKKLTTFHLFRILADYNYRRN